MIYEYPDPSAPIRQGDIFFQLPRLEISLKRVLVYGEENEHLTTWEDIASIGGSVSIIVPARPVTAIVATQDCDAIRGRDITLCEIVKFQDIERKSINTTSPKSWRNIITQQSRINLKWFYLPPDDKLGYSEKMAVDFMMTLRIPRLDLEDMRYLRKGRLNEVADEHFRERISEYFRRYPYDEWYPLNQEELNSYMTEYPDIKPFPWQS